MEMKKYQDIIIGFGKGKKTLAITNVACIPSKFLVLPAQAISKAQVIGRHEGLLKAIIDGKTGKILGAH